MSLGNTAKKNTTVKFVIKSHKLAILRVNVDNYQVRKQRCTLLTDRFQAGRFVTVFTPFPVQSAPLDAAFYRRADPVSANTEISFSLSYRIPEEMKPCCQVTFFCLRNFYPL